MNFITALENAFAANKNPENAFAMAKYMKNNFPFLELKRRNEDAFSKKFGKKISKKLLQTQDKLHYHYIQNKNVNFIIALLKF
nr:DNA alkylation repair protein [uncultured Flavobacterium sp.]